jgi:hypothetical protein
MFKTLIATLVALAKSLRWLRAGSAVATASAVEQRRVVRYSIARGPGDPFVSPVGRGTDLEGHDGQRHSGTAGE